MSMLTRALGLDRVNQRVSQDRSQLQDATSDEGSGRGWQDAFNQTAGAFLNQQMPTFLKSLQMTREDGIRRGISTGDLGTSNEGDLVSAFQRNLSDSLGSLASSNYNQSRDRYFGLLGSQYDADTQAKNSQDAMIGGVAGQIGGQLMSHFFPGAP